MKLVPPLFLALMLIGCSHDRAPTAATPPVMTPSPSPTPNAVVSLWGFVIDPGGACIEAATVEAVRGQAQGQRIVQETPCDAWTDGGGFLFKDLTPGAEITLRASAPGWSTEQKTFVAGEVGTGKAVEIELKKS